MPEASSLKQCRNCGAYFRPERKNQVFCTGECRNKYYEEHYFHKVEAEKVCPRCGKTFRTSKPLAQTYCLPECRDNINEPLKFLDEAISSMRKFLDEHPERQRGYSKPYRVILVGRQE